MLWSRRKPTSIADVPEARPVPAPAETRSRGILSRFRRNERGNVAIIFGLTAVIAVTMVGGAVDFGRVYAFKSKMQQALDAAALAGATFLMMDPNHDVTKAGDQASNYFNSVIKSEYGAVGTPSVTSETQTVTMTAEASVPTPFLSLIGITSIPLNVMSLATGTALIAGGASDQEVELALMLDVTLSMQESAKTGGIKLTAMQEAAKNLIDILIPDSGNIHAKIALAPFSEKVNIGEYADLVTGQPLTKTETKTSQCKKQSCQMVDVCTKTKSVQVCTKTNSRGQCTQYKTEQQCTQYKKQEQCTTVTETCTTTTTTYLSRCMEERTGALKFSASAPGAGTGFVANYVSSESTATNCQPRHPIVPLTTDKTVLKQRIDAFDMSIWTAGHLGTAWAWYMLSPEWSSIFTGEAAPRPYGTENLRKVAVLMTDGEYNKEYYSSQGNATSQARSLCTAMKAAGIEVFTVGFMLQEAAAIETMRQCASSENHVLFAEDGQQLNAAFTSIAYRLVPIHLKK